METRRLKNIAILILLLLNALLLFLMVYQNEQGRRVARDAADELNALFAAEELSLSEKIDPTMEPLSPLLPIRKTETSSEIAAFLLGEVISEQSEGGGIFSYISRFGTVQFRSGGGFDTVRFVRPIEDADAFVREFCDMFGYADLSGTIAKGNGSVTAVKYIAGVPVYGCTVTLTFEGGYLTGVVGAYVDSDDAETDTREHLSCMSALIRFFDFRREEGVVCSEIKDVQCVYQLQSTGGTPQLQPLWVIETDTYSYLVDGFTGAVTRK